MNLGPHLGDERTSVLSHILNQHPDGYGLEFGVGRGRTLRLIATRMPAIGFDTFDGLPEDWRPGFPAGTFACEPPDIRGAQLVTGLYADTLPNWTPPGPIGLVHIDCDLYTSTATVLRHIGPHLKAGCFLVFDEWHGYPRCEDHEQRAWYEWAYRSGATWDTIGHGPEQWAIRLR